jgi:purine-nucleoside phosphorylase
MGIRFDNTILSAKQAAESAGAVADKINGVQPEIGIITGSGLSFGGINVSVRIPYTDIPYLPEPGVAGHSGEFVLAELGGKKALIARGRLHRYEGHSWDTITLPIRMFAALGCKYLILTAAVGSINPSITPGDIVVVKDHLNLMGDTPLAGFADPGLGDRFVDLYNVYNKTLRDLAIDKAGALNLNCHSGVYAAMLGPNYETPAEVAMIAKLGGDVVGMSTVPEAIVAAQCGLRTLGICVTANRAGERANHEEVVETVKRAENDIVRLIKAVIKEIG